MSLIEVRDAPASARQLSIFDFAYALYIFVVSSIIFSRYNHYMDPYEQGILFGSSVAFVILGWYWKAWRYFFPLVITISLIAIQLYNNNLDSAQQTFWLKYCLSSQSSIMWMCTLFFITTVIYWSALIYRSHFLENIGSALMWAAATMGCVGLFTRWYESYLIAPDVGHIPISNLYEVFILFCLITALMCLYYESRFRTHQLGAFVSLIITVSVSFILWYTFERQAHEIQPLIPALQSWWMKIHVPANFIGYGAFTIAAMLGIAELLVLYGFLENRLPSAQILDEIMYKAITIGFLFFTIATILGAMWAADAWGGYWSWDPKETWALIVWLNYAAWLHSRLVKGWHGKPLAWWAIIGLVVTSFAFLGVNMFLSGLHSYGGL